MIRKYATEVGKLADLESFDPEAFISDDKMTQASCDFVLALALVFNDLKDLLLGNSLLIKEAPTDQTTPTKELGAFAGAHFHFYRLFLAVLCELLYVVNKNADVLMGPSFLAVVKNLPERPRLAWQKIVTAAEVGSSSDPDIKFLLVARNTVAFHYDRKAMGRGYRAAFPDTSRDMPYVSRGANITGTRFYFADRAAQSYLQQAFGDQDLHQYFLRQPEFIPDVGVALFTIVTAFVNTRGFAWRSAAV